MQRPHPSGFTAPYKRALRYNFRIYKTSQRDPGMIKKWIATAFLLGGSTAFAVGVSVIVPYEDDTEKPAQEKTLTEAQQKQEALFRERIKQRDEMRRKKQKEQEMFYREQRQRHEDRAREERRLREEREDGQQK